MLLKKTSNSYTNVFIVSLSIADFLASLSLIGSVVALIREDGWSLPNAEWFCDLSAVLLITCVGVSLYNLAAIAINRMVLITQPTTTYAKIYKKWNLVMIVATVWIVPILVVTITPLLNVGGIGYDYEDTTCSDLNYHPNAMIYTLIQCLYFCCSCSHYHCFMLRKNTSESILNTNVIMHWLWFH